MTQQSPTLTHLSPNPGPDSRVRTRLSHAGRRHSPYSVLHRGFWTALSLSCHPGPVWLERPYQGQPSFWDHLDTQTSPPHKGGTSGGEWMHFFRWKTVTFYCTFGVDWVLSKTLTSGWDERRSLHSFFEGIYFLEIPASFCFFLFYHNKEISKRTEKCYKLTTSENWDDRKNPKNIEKVVWSYKNAFNFTRHWRWICSGLCCFVDLILYIHIHFIPQVNILVSLGTVSACVECVRSFFFWTSNLYLFSFSKPLIDLSCMLSVIESLEKKKLSGRRILSRLQN